jgi:uncharacterized protein with HEPN domain
MSDAAPREWRFYVDDMIGFAEKVCAYSEGLDQAGFAASGINYDATLRNRLIHGYLGIDNDTLWSVIKTDIPALLPQLQELRKWVG